MKCKNKKTMRCIGSRATGEIGVGGWGGKSGVRIKGDMSNRFLFLKGGNAANYEKN